MGLKLLTLFIISILFVSCDKKGSQSLIYTSREPEMFHSRKSDSLNAMGLKAARNGDIDRARTYFQQALKIEPNNPSIINNIGLLQFNIGNLDSAAYYCELSLLQSDSTYINAASNLGLIYFRRQDYDKCITIAEYIEHNSHDGFLIGIAKLNQAMALNEQSRCLEARVAFQKANSLLLDHDGTRKQVQAVEQAVSNCTGFMFIKPN